MLILCELCGFKHDKDNECPETKKCPMCGKTMLLHDRKTYCSDICHNQKREENAKYMISYLNDYFNNAK